MMKSFEQVSSNFLAETDRSTEEYEFGHYGKIYARPSQRLASLLATERELLIIFTTFQEQQFRTIKALKHFIEKEEGRIESTVSIIIHCDPSGSLKLKKWGRDENISILPLYFDGQLPSGAEFERVLCRELFSHDPFDVTGPVSDDSQFYGRRTEAQDLARQLQKGQIRTCLGIRKCGKTSLLNRVMQILRHSHECYAIMVDCSKDNIWEQSAIQLLQSLSEAIINAEQGSDRYAIATEPLKKTTRSESSANLLKALQACDHPVVIFIDEVDYITPGSPTAEHWLTDFNIFWRNLRAAYQEADRQGKKLSILIGGVSSKWFSIESIEGIENAALAFIPQEYLSPLPRGASIPMIKNIARTCGLQFDEDNADPIANACSDIPFWIRKAGSFLHRNIDFNNRPIRPDKSIIETLLNQFIEVEGTPLAQVALSHLFRVYPELEEPARLMLTGDITNISKNSAYHLERYGIASTGHGKTQISGIIMRNALEHHFSEKSAQPAATPPLHTSNSISFTSTDEWAEELAIVNKRRNIVEKKLREIALNFIRFHCLQNGKPALSQIIAILPEQQREKLSSTSAEVAISKFLWTDLTKLINKEWTLFERIFKDKSSFTQNTSIINERFDAHAKDADQADLALYRRALKWVEDALSNL